LTVEPEFLHVLWVFVALPPIFSLSNQIAICVNCSDWNFTSNACCLGKGERSAHPLSMNQIRCIVNGDGETSILTSLASGLG